MNELPGRLAWSLNPWPPCADQVYANTLDIVLVQSQHFDHHAVRELLTKEITAEVPFGDNLFPQLLFEEAVSAGV